jgi:fumarate hydratase class II
VQIRPLAAPRSEHKTIREVAVARGLLTLAQFDALIAPEAVMRLGSTSGP